MGIPDHALSLNLLLVPFVLKQEGKGGPDVIQTEQPLGPRAGAGVS